MSLTVNGSVGAETEAVVREVAAAHRAERGPLLEILHGVQERLGCVPPEAVQVLADELNLSYADVHGVVSFYHDFRSEPAGRTTVRVCEAEACQSVGARDLVARLKEQYGAAHGDTTADRSLTVERVFCFGNCALGPTVEINGRLHGRVDPDRLGSLVDKELGR
ncbi:formate dehydrogenase subunit gamma [Nocardioides thalensis]|uniref:Formate dehydrogenase subunit gamma n=1 Tax=Nocardioides thalensis TaxID=1914755 RepID=A0A853C438_9ACTN|nr:NAD(P)H-dependent oxidoreductase subunit E [Nocardioides thalensis]NYJ01766.1 formate dehydrogenase subunit gamma [Nocardioides thalensis]